MNEEGEWVHTGVSVSPDVGHYNCYAYAINEIIFDYPFYRSNSKDLTLEEIMLTMKPLT